MNTVNPTTKNLTALSRVRRGLESAPVRLLLRSGVLLPLLGTTGVEEILGLLIVDLRHDSHAPTLGLHGIHLQCQGGECEHAASLPSLSSSGWNRLECGLAQELLRRVRGRPLKGDSSAHACRPCIMSHAYIEGA